MKILEQCVPDTKSDQCKGLEMEKRIWTKHQESCMARGKGVRVKAIQVDGGDISGARSRGEGGVEFRLYSKFNGKPLKGFVEG